MTAKRNRVVRTAALAAAGALFLLSGCSPAPAHPIATFQVAGGETYKSELITPELVEHAEQLLAGEPVAAIPLGTVVRDSPGVNEPWSWHIDPATIEIADMTIEACDGIPSLVEDGTFTSDQFCPWSAEVVEIEQ